MNTSGKKLNILVVDDELQMRVAMQEVLTRLEHKVETAENGAQGFEKLKAGEFDLVISDMKMPEMNGQQLLTAGKKLKPLLPFVMITAYGTIEHAVEIMRLGAFDFITKPFSAEDLERVVSRLSAPRYLPTKDSPASSEKTSKENSRIILSNSKEFRQVLRVAEAIAPSTASVLVQGESGTGKELIARLIHSASDRNSGPFVAVNCAALPSELLESELFGHEKGSFTGAINSKTGKFELANGGTILLDEVTEMDKLLQAKLLRVLQEREIDRVGGSRPLAIDVRVVATTNRNIQDSVLKGEFREDLFYRLNVIPLIIPPLREREGDIILLAEHFVRKFSEGEIFRLPEDVKTALTAYSWPGNIRELENCCQRSVLMARIDREGSAETGSLEILPEHFQLEPLKPVVEAAEGANGAPSLIAGMSVADAERKLIFETLKATGNNRTKAAEMLGISIRTLRNKLHEYDEKQSLHS